MLLWRCVFSLYLTPYSSIRRTRCLHNTCSMFGTCVDIIVIFALDWILSFTKYETFCFITRKKYLYIPQFTLFQLPKSQVIYSKKNTEKPAIYYVTNDLVNFSQYSRLPACSVCVRLALKFPRGNQGHLVNRLDRVFRLPFKTELYCSLDIHTFIIGVWGETRIQFHPSPN
jgi:hypothetical protein